jgi:hypothetical protein
MSDYFAPGMHLYLERLVDWDLLLTLQRGAAVDVEAEVGSYRTILETAAAVTESLEPRELGRPGRAHARRRRPAAGSPPLGLRQAARERLRVPLRE